MVRVRATVRVQQGPLVARVRRLKGVLIRKHQRDRCFWFSPSSVLLPFSVLVFLSILSFSVECAILRQGFSLSFGFFFCSPFLRFLFSVPSPCVCCLLSIRPLCLSFWDFLARRWAGQVKQNRIMGIRFGLQYGSWAVLMDLLDWRYVWFQVRANLT